MSPSVSSANLCSLFFCSCSPYLQLLFYDLIIVMNVLSAPLSVLIHLWMN